MNAYTRTKLFGLLAAAACPASAAEVRIDLISGFDFVAGDAPNGSSTVAHVSPDGRFLAFTSSANNLGAGVADRNGATDAMVLDRATGEVDHVSVAADDGGRAGGGESAALAISDDGRFVYFSSRARDLVAGVTLPSFAADPQLYLFDRESRTTQLVSHVVGDPLVASSRGADGSFRLSADGRFAIFHTDSTNMVPNASLRRQVYLFDRQSGAVRLVSHAAGQPAITANDFSLAVDLSADGAWVLYESDADDLVAGVGDAGGIDTFLWQAATDTSMLISRRAADPLLATGGRAYDLSADGRFVLFGSRGVEVLADPTLDGNGSSREDVFIHDRLAGSARLASPSVASASISADHQSIGHRLSDDGRYAYFTSQASNLVAAFVDLNGTGRDYYVFDSLAGATALASRSSDDPTAGANQTVAAVLSARPISPAGDFALFETEATNLEAGVADGNGSSDLYLFQLAAGQPTLVSRLGARLEASGAVEDNGVVAAGGRTFSTAEQPLDAIFPAAVVQRLVRSFDPAAAASSLEVRARESGFSPLLTGTRAGRLTPDGRFVAWRNRLFDRLRAASELIGHRAGDPATPANASYEITALSPDGRFLAATSAASDLVAGLDDQNGVQDAFFYDRNVDAHFLLSHRAGNPGSTAAGVSETTGWMAADAKRFVLESLATDLVAGESGPPSLRDVFFHDRPAGGVASLISHSALSPTRDGDHHSAFIGISADQRFVLFDSTASDLVAGFVDHNDYFSDDFGFIRLRDLYFHDRTTGATTLVSHRPGLPNEGSVQRETWKSLVTADGSAVFHGSYFVTELEFRSPQVERWDRASNTNQLLTQLYGGPLSPCGDDAELEDATADGLLVLITTVCAFVPGDGNGLADAYLVDRGAGVFRLISHQPGNPAIAAGGRGGKLAAGGARVVYSDPAGVPHSYDRGSGRSTRLTSAYFDDRRPVAATVLETSAAGDQILVSSPSGELAPFDANGTHDLFLITLGDLFADGFESGTTAAWSLAVP